MGGIIYFSNCSNFSNYSWIKIIQSGGGGSSFSNAILRFSPEDERSSLIPGTTFVDSGDDDGRRSLMYGRKVVPHPQQWIQRKVFCTTRVLFFSGIANNQTMAGVLCPVSSSSTLPAASVSRKPWHSRHSLGAVSVSMTPGRGTGVHTSSRSQRPFVLCKAIDRDQIGKAKKFQMQATEVLAELLKSTNAQATASKYLDHLSEDFFMVASTYLEMAKKEGNVEVMKKIEEVLEIAMIEKGKTLRPEIQLMNKLLNETDQYERAKTMQSNSLYIMDSDSYFYELLQRMVTDVENLKDSPKKQKLLTQIRTVSREVKEAGKALRRAK